MSGDAKDFNAVARHLNQLSEGHGFTIIKAGGIKNSSMLYRCERSGRYQAKEGSAKGEVYTKKCECPWSIRVRRLEGPVTSKGDRAIVFEPGMHVIQYPEEDHNHEMKARLCLLGDSTSYLSYSDAEENQFWEMARSYFRKRLYQSEAHGNALQALVLHCSSSSRSQCNCPPTGASFMEKRLYSNGFRFPFG